jgi:site-specific recombinase XerD
LNFKEALDRYELDAHARGITRSNITHVKGIVVLFIGFLGTVDDVRRIGADDFRRYLASLRDRHAWQGSAKQSQNKLTGTSINTYARAIKSFWAWLKQAGLIEANPLAAVAAPKIPKTIPVVYSDEEIRAVYDVVKDTPVVKSVFLLFLDSGIRLSELTSLSLANLDLTNRRLKVRGKGNKERLAYFSDFTAESINGYLKGTSTHHRPGSKVFLDNNGLPLTNRQIQVMLAKAGKQAGLIRRLAPHKLRHTYATLALRNGGNLEYLRITLGHTDIKTTSEAYLNVADADIARAHRKFSPVANLFVTVDNIKSMESENQEAQSKRKTYDETPHKRQMRELAKATAVGIRLPSPWDKVLWRDLPVEFKPGKYYLPIGAVEIGEDKQIKVNYYDIGAAIAEAHLVKGLFSHLSTSGSSKFMELVGDKGKLSDLVFKAGQYSQALLNFLKLITDEVKGYRAQLDFHDEAKPGLTKWFIISAWNDAIQKAGGYSWIDNSWYKPYESVPGTNLWKLNCGAYAIGIAKSEKTLKTCENWHKKLRLKYEKDPLAKGIAVKDQELGIIAQYVKQRLQEFSDMQQVPGHCELC